MLFLSILALFSLVHLEQIQVTLPFTEVEEHQNYTLSEDATTTGKFTIFNAPVYKSAKEESFLSTQDEAGVYRCSSNEKIFIDGDSILMQFSVRVNNSFEADSHAHMVLFAEEFDDLTFGPETPYYAKFGPKWDENSTEVEVFLGPGYMNETELTLHKFHLTLKDHINDNVSHLFSLKLTPNSLRIDVDLKNIYSEKFNFTDCEHWENICCEQKEEEAATEAAEEPAETTTEQHEETENNATTEQEQPAQTEAEETQTEQTSENISEEQKETEETEAPVNTADEETPAEAESNTATTEEKPEEPKEEQNEEPKEEPKEECKPEILPRCICNLTFTGIGFEVKKGNGFVCIAAACGVEKSRRFISRTRTSRAFDARRESENMYILTARKEEYARALEESRVLVEEKRKELEAEKKKQQELIEEKKRELREATKDQRDFIAKNKEAMIAEVRNKILELKANISAIQQKISDRRYQYYISDNFSKAELIAIGFVLGTICASLCSWMSYRLYLSIRNKDWKNCCNTCSSSKCCKCCKCSCSIKSCCSKCTNSIKNCCCKLFKKKSGVEETNNNNNTNATSTTSINSPRISVSSSRPQTPFSRSSSVIPSNNNNNTNNNNITSNISSIDTPHTPLPQQLQPTASMNVPFVSSALTGNNNNNNNNNNKNIQSSANIRRDVPSPALPRPNQPRQRRTRQP